jgi:hypothetical protein
MGRVIVIAATGALLGSCVGCGHAGSLPGAGGAAERAYLVRLSAEQAKLAAAERRLPTRPRTPAALSRSITLLGAAIRRLAEDLRAIHPPASVATLHLRLTSIVRGYSLQLIALAREARVPGREISASRALVAATDQASRAFAAISQEINSRIKR